MVRGLDAPWSGCWTAYGWADLSGPRLAQTQLVSARICPTRPDRLMPDRIVLFTPKEASFAQRANHAQSEDPSG